MNALQLVNVFDLGCAFLAEDIREEAIIKIALDNDDLSPEAAIRKATQLHYLRLGSAVTARALQQTPCSVMAFTSIGGDC